MVHTNLGHMITEKEERDTPSHCTATEDAGADGCRRPRRCQMVWIKRCADSFITLACYHHLNLFHLLLSSLTPVGELEG